MESTSGFTHSSYGQNTRILNQAINRLRECGSEAILGEMPKIAVIGNQSAGKSSLIEAMSGIRVPRQVGTCTRCPMEVVLSHSEGDTHRWSCQISLRMMFDGTEEALTTPVVFPFGDMLYDPGQVEVRLRRAQDAVLRWPADGWNPEIFLEDDWVSGELFGFSRNVVRLDVSGPDLVDVTFIDLPGIITNANQKWVDTVNKLVTDYISQPDCLILVAINMAGAASLARTFDKAGERTIGVLTKADMVTDEQRFQRWSAIIAGDDIEHRLAHGYYLTMQKRPSATASWLDNHNNESQFFRTDNLWSRLTERHRRCFGTVELRRKLSLELSRLIKNRIPVLINEVNQCVRSTNEELRALPRPINEAPQHYLLKLCNDFITHLTDCIKGDNDRKDLALKVAEADHRFINFIKGSIAQFGLADYDEKRRGILGKSANELLFEKQPPPEKPSMRTAVPDVDDDIVDVTPSRRNIPQTPQRQRQPPPKRTSQQRAETPHTPPAEENSSGITYTGERIDLEEIRGMIRRERARRLPGAAPSVLQERLIHRAVKDWHNCAHEYFNDVHDAVVGDLTQLTRVYFAQFTESGLFNAVWEVNQQVVKDLTAKAASAIAEQVRMESRPFTQDNSYLNITSTNLLKKMVDYRRTENAKSASQEFGTNFLVPDEYDAELILIAHVLAYLDVAYKRFGDMIPMRVEEKFQTPLANMIQKQLMDKFLVGEGCEERCRAYLEDAPELTAQRREIAKKLDVLRAAEQEVRKFQAC